jgi:hypothetical protein
MNRNQALLVSVLLLLGALRGAFAEDAANEPPKPEQAVEVPKADALPESGAAKGAAFDMPAETGPAAGYGSVTELLQAIPGTLMPPGTMSPLLEGAFKTWASKTLSGSTLVVDGSVDAVTTNQAGDVILTVNVRDRVAVHGRKARCEIRALVRQGGAISGLSVFQPGAAVTLKGTLAKAGPLVPERRVVKMISGSQAVNGWSDSYAFFGIALEDCERMEVPEAKPVAAEKPEEPAPPPPAEEPPPPAEPAPEPQKAAPPSPPPVERSAEFFGVKSGPAGGIVFVVDRSGSMTDSIDFVKCELKRSLADLAEDQTFHVLFYSSGPPLEMPQKKLVPASAEWKQRAVAFIDDVIPQGETDPSKALERAFELQPDTIYLLTDGEFDKATVGLVKRLNAAGKVKVHTIGFLYRMGEQVLKQIADQNGGQYKFVTEKDLADLVKRGGL